MNRTAISCTTFVLTALLVATGPAWADETPLKLLPTPKSVQRTGGEMPLSKTSRMERILAIISAKDVQP